MRFVSRVLAVFAFAFAVMFTVIDATRSIGVSAPVLTPFGETFELIAPERLEGLREWLGRNAPGFVTDVVLASLLSLPTFAVFAAFAFLFWLLGRPPRPRGLRRLRP
ncbi:hypothetical protein [Oricola thermophila]|uniref:PetM family of cytochrome b6f complex subunit 7 n=1 Tax=Oricola thermophila TaxID=2742145 RepID=A0A6N1VG22_9HYPH|nr:hypothetical protein [Oricola thermophila]QKV19738.1 hypothetical protein HTY61_15385 [Oricola thermophila]